MLTDKEKGQIMVASGNGAQIQRKPRENGVRWQDIERPAWNWVLYRYRVAPSTGYFAIVTDKPWRIFSTRESAMEDLEEFKQKFPDAAIIELVPKV